MPEGNSPDEQDIREHRFLKTITKVCGGVAIGGFLGEAVDFFVDNFDLDHKPAIIGTIAAIAWANLYPIISSGKNQLSGGSIEP